MNITIVLLWSFAVLLATVFAAVLVAVTLKPKIPLKKRLTVWGTAAVGSYILTVLSYMINLRFDLFGILGLAVILCIVVDRMYQGDRTEKLFVSIMAALISDVGTFLLCGSADTFLGSALGFFKNRTPYNVPNIMLFIGIKIVVYTVIFLWYKRFVLAHVRAALEQTAGHMNGFLLAPCISLVGFYLINLMTNRLGIMPTSVWYFPFYLVISLIFVFEYLQIFQSVDWSAKALQAQKEKQRIGAELNVATQIQSHMLPSIFPPFPERSEFDIYATMHPAKEVGGDFYDFFMIDDDHIALVMADVSGKGIPAALFMVIAKTLIKNRAQMGGTPGQILEDVNNRLCEGNEAEMFVTVWLAIVQLSTGKGIAANAGHEHPVLRCANGEFELVKYRHSPAVATMEDMMFREHEFELHPGDRLFVYTDGVPEATNEADELYGTDRMLDVLNRNRNAGIMDVLPALKTDITNFVGAAPQFDDITMLLFDYYGTKRKPEDQLHIAASVDHLDQVLGFVETKLEKYEFSPKAVTQILIAVEEIFVNVANYAYAPDKKGDADICITFDADANEVCIEVRDSGQPYDPLTREDPDITLSAEEREVGGLGIFMTKKIMDRVNYAYEGNRNVLRMYKKVR